MAIAALLVSACGNLIIGIALLSKRVELESAAQGAADMLLEQIAAALKGAEAVSAGDNGLRLSFLDRRGEALLLCSGSGGDICLTPAGRPEESRFLASGAGRFEFDALLSGVTAEKADFGGYEVKGRLALSYEGRSVKELDFYIYTSIG